MVFTMAGISAPDALADQHRPDGLVALACGRRPASCKQR
jgi:hypothetical protein